MEKPIRVAQIIGKLNAAGVEAVINNYYRNINRNCYQFDFFIDADSQCTPSSELIKLGARYYTIPPYQNLPEYIYALVKYFKSNRYLIVHSNMNTISVFSLFAAWFAGVPIRINHNHSTAGKGEIKKNILKYILRPFAKLFATDYCACSRYAGEWLFGKQAVQKEKVIILNNAINCEKFKYNKSVREEVRQELGLESRFIVGHVGRFCYQKNHDFLIEVFKQLHQKDPKALLLLVGQGEMQDDIKHKVKNENLSDSVLFLGVRKDVWRLYQAMDCFVLPSKYEGLGIVGIEAQAAGLPCVFSNNVPNETNLIDKNVQYLSLDDPIELWTSTILGTRGFERKDTSDEIRKAGFDIKEQSGQLQSFYDKCLLKIQNK